MRSVFAAHRRAETFHESVEGTSGRTPSDPAFTDLLDLVTALRAEPPPQARPEFVADLRERLMAAAETALAPEPAEERAPAVRRTPRERRLAVAVGGFAIVSATASMSVAAQSALPGDTLYPLKRAIENIQTGVQRGADDKGTTMLDNAAGRLAEVDELSRADERDSEVIAQTLRDFTDQATEASDLLLDDYADTGSEHSIRELRAFTSQSIASLDALEGLVPAGARDSLVDAARVLDRIERLAIRACPACSDLQEAVSSLGRALELDDPFAALLDPAPGGDDASAADAGGAPSGPPRTPPELDEDELPLPIETEDPLDPLDQPDPPILPDPGSDDEPGQGTGQGTGEGTGEGKGEGKGKKGGPLAPITAGLASDDPLGGLLEGAAETVDDTLGGLLGGGSAP